MNVIKEYLIKKLSESSILEMALNRKEYKKNLEGIGQQIIENWCLLRYISISNKKNELKNHWENELKGHIVKLIKPKTDFNKVKLLKEFFLNKLEYTDTNVIYWSLSDKWEKESLDIEDSDTQQVIEDFCSYGIEEIIDLIGTTKLTIADVKDYIQTI